MIEIKNVVKKYGERIVLNDVSLELPDRGIVALVGASGSGKSTLLNLISGIDNDYKGEISCMGTLLKKLDGNKMSSFRLHHIGYVFQNFNLLNLENVEDNIKIVLDSSTNDSEQMKKRRIKDFLLMFGIFSNEKTQINKLSGGEKQRVAIIRALINEPEIILCDEPTGALDEQNSFEIFNILQTISRSALVVIATHDLEGVRRVANQIISIEDGKIVSVEEKMSKQTFQRLKVSSPVNKTKKSSLPWSFKIKHSFNKIKTKKWRSVITNFMFSLSLTGFGLSFLISNSISGKVTDAFNEIVQGNQIVMSLKNESSSTFSNVYAAPLSKVDEIYSKYNYFLDGYGVNYLVNFEDFFKNGNDLYISSKANKIYIPSLSARSFNDYRWISDSTIVYPYSPTDMNDDQMILGLTYQTMSNICYSLHIKRNFSSLGNYIKDTIMQITFEVVNDDWQYSDEQIFNVVGVVESNKDCLYHTNHLWNQTIFEDQMRFPTNDNNQAFFPWEMYKVYYFETIEEPSVFLDSANYDEELFDFVFEKASSNYFPELCNNNDICEARRILIYYADKTSIDPADLNYLLDYCQDFNDFYFTSDYGYSSYSNHLLSGFSHNLFISDSEGKIDLAIDADTSLSSETNVTLNLPGGVYQGNFLNALSGGVKFSTKIDHLISGRLPKNDDEIVISYSLAKKLDLTNGFVYIASESNEVLENSLLIKDYRKAKVNVVGINYSNSDFLYHSNNWTISFFRDKIGASSFNLIPRQVIFELDENVKTDNLVVKLTKLLPKYKFSSPIIELTKSIDSTLEYAEIIMLGFAIISTLISLLLLGTITSLNVQESLEEIKLLKYLGICKEDIRSSFVTQTVLQGLVGFFLSSIEIILVDILVSKGIGTMFGVNLQISVNFLPIFLMLIIAILLPLLIAEILVGFNLKKID